MTRPDDSRWETEALRESAARRRKPPSPAFRPPRGRAQWVTLRDAHDATQIPVETLRKWARRGHVASEIRETEFGTRRVVDIVAVRRRAEELGRRLPATPAGVNDPDRPEAVPPSAAVTAADATHPEPDLEDRSEPQTITTPTPETMIVPIAAWDRMLMQLGNLHQAGQQLADARERAAKAETEARFLRERLAELRSEIADAESARLRGPATEPDPGLRRWRFFEGRRRSVR